MTRVATTDLLLMFTMDANSTPSTTEGGKVITKLYKRCYTLAYPSDPDKYSSDDSTDDEQLIDITAVFDIVEEQAEETCDDWFLSGVEKPKPAIAFTKTREKKLVRIFANKRGRLHTIQLYGGDMDDVAV